MPNLGPHTPPPDTLVANLFCLIYSCVVLLGFPERQGIRSWCHSLCPSSIQNLFTFAALLWSSHWIGSRCGMDGGRLGSRKHKQRCRIYSREVGAARAHLWDVGESAQPAAEPDSHDSFQPHLLEGFFPAAGAAHTPKPRISGRLKNLVVRLLWSLCSSSSS